jgi:hypothetical protein
MRCLGETACPRLSGPKRRRLLGPLGLTGCLQCWASNRGRPRQMPRQRQTPLPLPLVVVGRGRPSAPPPLLQTLVPPAGVPPLRFDRSCVNTHTAPSLLSCPLGGPCSTWRTRHLCIDCETAEHPIHCMSPSLGIRAEMGWRGSPMLEGERWRAGKNGGWGRSDLAPSCRPTYVGLGPPSPSLWRQPRLAPLLTVEQERGQFRLCNASRTTASDDGSKSRGEGGLWAWVCIAIVG